MFVAAAGRTKPVQAPLDIIFVHGLTGNFRDTWGDPDEFWPRWLAEDFPTCNLYTASYASSVFTNIKRGPGMTAGELAGALTESVVNRECPARSVMFVTHSLGGVVVKQMIRQCADSADKERNDTARSVRGVVFLATPHQGSRLGELCDFILKESKSALARQLTFGDDTLVDLHEYFRSWAGKNHIVVKAFYETNRTWGFQVVDKISANPHVFGIDPVPVAADHIEICKPKSRTAPVFVSVSKTIRTLLNVGGEPPSTSPSSISRPAPRLEAIADPNAGLGSDLDMVPDYGDAVRFRDQMTDLVSHAEKCFFVSVEGISGSGKTYLVAGFLRESLAIFRWDRVVWHDATGDDDIDAFLTSFPDVRTVPGWSQAAKVSALVAHLRATNTMFVIDDCHLADEAAIGNLLDAAGRHSGACRIICIGQVRLSTAKSLGRIARYVPELLTLSHTGTIVERLLGRRLSERQVSELQRVSGGLPFAVALFCMLVTDRGYAVDALIQGAALGRHTTLESWCKKATDHIESAHRQFLFSLALVEGQLDRAMAETIARALDLQNFNPSFEQIIDWHLLRRQSETTWTMHRILADYCTAQLPRDVKQVVLTGIGEMYRARGVQASDDSVRVQEFALGCRYLIAAGELRKAEKLLLGFVSIAKRIGHHTVLKNLLAKLGEQLAPRLLGNWPSYHYAHCLFLTGEVARAHKYLDRYLHQARGQDPTVRLSCQRLLVEIFLSQDKLEEAVSALDIASSLARKDGITTVARRQFLGVCFQVQMRSGNLREAEASLNESLKIPGAEDQGTSSGVLQMCLSQLAEVKGRYAESLDLAARALKDFEVVVDMRGMLWAETRIGLNELRLGRAAEGIERILAGARRLSQFELTPQDFKLTLQAALSACSDDSQRESLQTELARLSR